VKRFDIVYAIEEACSPEFGCICAPIATEDASTAAFHLVRVDIDGTQSRVIEIDVPVPENAHLQHWLDARAFGTESAVAWFDSTTLADGAMRVLRIDTTALDE
jgi:hypothetical protein